MSATPTITTIETPELGNRSYVVDDGSYAVVIDPQRDIDRLRQVAPVAERQVSLVLETHVHNDYLTGGLELARSVGADYGVNADDPVRFDRLGLRPGEEIEVGSLTVQVLATPGHTDTHLAYLVRSGEDAPALFTGGSLLYGSVGRTDLLGEERALELARAQFRSTRSLAGLPDDTRVFPTHGFGSFCSAVPSSGESTLQTLGDLRRSNPALLADDEDVFAKALVAGYGAYPSYYAHMAERNLDGPHGIDPHPIRALDDDQLIDLLRAGQLIDLRTGEEFASTHLRGSLSIPAGAQFATYAGWLLPWGRPLGLIGVDDVTLEDARVQLARIGIEAVAGRSDAVATLAPAEPRGSIDRVTFDAVAAGRAAGDRLLDVRRRDEFETDRVPGALNIPVHELESRLGEIPAGRVWTYCAGGFRAGTAASILARAGRDVVHIDDPFTHAVELGLTERDRQQEEQL